MSKEIKPGQNRFISVTCCAECPLNGTCSAWSKLDSKTKTFLNLSNSVPVDMMLVECPLKQMPEQSAELEQLRADHKQLESDYTEEFNATEDLRCDKEDLTKELEQLRKELELTKWIDIKDCEPEFTGTYLVTGNDIEMEFSHFCEDFGWQDSYEITHWMNCPELPNQQGE